MQPGDPAKCIGVAPPQHPYLCQFDYRAEEAKHVVLGETVFVVGVGSEQVDSEGICSFGVWEDTQMTQRALVECIDITAISFCRFLFGCCPLRMVQIL